MSRATVEQWHDVLGEALRDHEIAAVPGILVAMALDGYGHEAEEARRQMLKATAIVRASAEPDAWDECGACGHDRDDHDRVGCHNCTLCLGFVEDAS